MGNRHALVVVASTESAYSQLREVCIQGSGRRSRSMRLDALLEEQTDIRKIVPLRTSLRPHGTTTMSRAIRRLQVHQDHRRSRKSAWTTQSCEPWYPEAMKLSTSSSKLLLTKNGPMPVMRGLVSLQSCVSLMRHLPRLLAAKR